MVIFWRLGKRLRQRFLQLGDFVAGEAFVDAQDGLTLKANPGAEDHGDENECTGGQCAEHPCAMAPWWKSGWRAPRWGLNAPLWKRDFTMGCVQRTVRCLAKRGERWRRAGNAGRIRRRCGQVIVHGFVLPRCG